MQRRFNKLGEILIKAGIITRDQLNWALDAQKQTPKRLGILLVDLGLASEEDITEAYGFQMDFPYIELDPTVIHSETLNLLPESIVRAYNVFPLSATGDRLVIAMANPMDIEAIDAAQRASRRRIEPVLASRTRIQKAIEHVFDNNDRQDIDTSLEQAVENIELDESQETATDVAEERRMSDQAPVVKAVNLVLKEAIKQHASDIHIEPKANGMEIRYRIDGVLVPVRSIPKRLQLAVCSRIKIMGEMDISEKRKPQDGRLAIKIEDRMIDLRVSSYPVLYGEKIVIRILDKQAHQYPMEQLGFRVEDMQIFESLIQKPHGIILVTGPTGSGKTTSLYSAINRIRSSDINIMTCEDPIEYEMQGINQSAINSKAGITFASQLRAILRQDPDVILVGEIRDTETAEIAFRAALTGHLVFSTLHSNDAPSAITRLIDMGIEPFLIGSCVTGVIAQRLVRLLCPHCKAPYQPNANEMTLRNLIGKDAGSQYFKPVGCPHCNMQGYAGRTVAAELMVMNANIRRCIAERPTSEEIMRVAVESGMNTIMEHAIEKVAQGLTSFDEVRRKIFISDDITEMLSRLRGNGLRNAA